tara:strand:- start:13850 stop:13975 length:126 start_codon:yes stop_codon:yes gene_type:complete
MVKVQLILKHPVASYGESSKTMVEKKTAAFIGGIEKLGKYS